jgi:hypothetical protein
LKDIAKGQSEGGGQTMQKGNQKKVDRQCKLITFLHFLSTAF